MPESTQQYKGQAHLKIIDGNPYEGKQRLAPKDAIILLNDQQLPIRHISFEIGVDMPAKAVIEVWLNGVEIDADVLALLKAAPEEEVPYDADAEPVSKSEQEEA